MEDQTTNYSGFVDISNFQRFLLSLFGKMSHGEFSNVQEILKVPFTFFPSELPYYTYVDTRMGGMGALFSGVLVLSFILLGVLIHYCISRKKVIPNWIALFIAFSISSALYMTLLPLTFMLRYVGVIYFFPVFLLVISRQMSEEKTGKKVLVTAKVVSGLLSLTIVLNMLPWVTVHIQRINRSMDTRATLQMLQNMQLDKQQLQISIFHRDFTGIHYNLQEDFDLEYSYVDFEQIGELGGFVPTFSEWVYYHIVD